MGGDHFSPLHDRQHRFREVGGVLLPVGALTHIPISPYPQLPKLFEFSVNLRGNWFFVLQIINRRQIDCRDVILLMMLSYDTTTLGT